MDFTHEVTLNKAQFEFYQKVNAPLISVDQLQKMLGF